ncbi:MAG: secondary thiamine-phosphate synthase enzyme YjbQ [Thermoplasmata archaeon]
MRWGGKGEDEQDTEDDLSLQDDCPPMPPFTETLKIKTNKNLEIVNITNQVEAAVKKSGVKEGSLVVFTPHTTTAITVNEDEPGLVKDILRKISELVPKGAGYSHDSIDHNAHSHILASIIGCSVALPVINGKAALGTWQSILFIELDGPRNRNVVVQIG